MEQSRFFDVDVTEAVMRLGLAAKILQAMPQRLVVDECMFLLQQTANGVRLSVQTLIPHDSWLIHTADNASLPAATFSLALHEARLCSVEREGVFVPLVSKEILYFRGMLEGTALSG